VKSQKLCFVCTMARSQCKKSQCFLSIEISSNKEVEKSGFLFFFSPGLRVEGLGFRVKGLPFPT